MKHLALVIAIVAAAVAVVPVVVALPKGFSEPLTMTGEVALVIAVTWYAAVLVVERVRRWREGRVRSR